MATELKEKAKALLNPDNKESRKKASLEVITAHYDVVSINGIRAVSNAYGNTYTFTISEDDELYFYANSILIDLFNMWLNNYKYEEVQNELKENPLKVRIYECTSKKGSNYYAVKVVD